MKINRKLIHNFTNIAFEGKDTSSSHEHLALVVKFDEIHQKGIPKRHVKMNVIVRVHGATAGWGKVMDPYDVGMGTLHYTYAGIFVILPTVGNTIQGLNTFPPLRAYANGTTSRHVSVAFKNCTYTWRFSE